MVYPKIVRIDDETNLASLQIEPDPELPLEALVPARSADRLGRRDRRRPRVSPGTASREL